MEKMKEKQVEQYEMEIKIFRESELDGPVTQTWEQ